MLLKVHLYGEPHEDMIRISIILTLGYVILVFKNNLFISFYLFIGTYNAHLHLKTLNTTILM